MSRPASALWFCAVAVQRL